MNTNKRIYLFPPGKGHVAYVDMTSQAFLESSRERQLEVIAEIMRLDLLFRQIPPAKSDPRPIDVEDSVIIPDEDDRVVALAGPLGKVHPQELSGGDVFMLATRWSSWLTLFSGACTVSIEKYYSEPMLWSMTSGKCPKCFNLLDEVGVIMVREDGTKIDFKEYENILITKIIGSSGILVYIFKNIFNSDKARQDRLVRDMIAATKNDLYECLHCHERWFVWHDSVRLAPAVEQTPRFSGEPSILRIEESKIEEEPRGEASRLIDNSQCEASMTKEIGLKQRWITTYEYNIEDTIKLGGEASLGAEFLAKCKLKIDNELELKYNVKKEEEQTFEEK
ncbi:MAG: hypothetical protein Q9211_007166, partial [Gyalolechia sp. 1 TL-2023]